MEFFQHALGSDSMAAAASSPSGAANALGTVLGYIGAEAATTATFTRLLWPQRAFANLRLRHVPQLALLQPGGGPLYKTALVALDMAFKHGLFRGRDQGHMLGTLFFPDSSTDYTLHSTDAQFQQHTETSRNNIWVRVMGLMPFPTTSQRPNDLEKASTSAAAPLRARVAVRHLKLSVKETGKVTKKAYLQVDEEGKAFSLRSFVGVVTEEITGLAMASVVALVCRSRFAVLWILPLAMKLLGLATALRRDSLDLSAKDMICAKPQNFEVHMAPETGTFLVITGPPTLVLQFFRHYGHPKRDRLRESIQLGVIVIFALLFPIGLLCSVAWMPMPVQYAWLSYQMYVVGAMYVSRYMNVKTWASTEEGIAKLLAVHEGKGPVKIWADKTDGRVVEATIESSFFSRYSQGRAHAQTLLQKDYSSSRGGTQLHG